MPLFLPSEESGEAAPVVVGACVDDTGQSFLQSILGMGFVFGWVIGGTVDEGDGGGPVLGNAVEDRDGGVAFERAVGDVVEETAVDDLSPLDFGPVLGNTVEG